MTILLLISALTLSSIAAWYAIAGLIAIFAALPIPIMIMGGALEAAKLVVASWLYRNWKTIPFLFKTYFTSALIVLMLLTSMGIFGFLSKAHLDQNLETGDNTLKIQMIDQKIAREQRKIDDSNKQLAILDDVVQTLIDNDRISYNNGAVKVRKSQEEDRAILAEQIDTASEVIAGLQTEKLVLDQQKLELEAEVGPVKYIAELIYGETNRGLLEEAVRWVILMIVFVFDPLAVLMVMAANMEMTKGDRNVKNRKENKEKLSEGTETDSTKQNEESRENQTKTDTAMAVEKEDLGSWEDWFDKQDGVSDDFMSEELETLNKTEEVSKDTESQVKNRKVGRLLSEIEKDKTNKSRSFLKKVDGKIPSEENNKDENPFE